MGGLGVVRRFGGRKGGKHGWPSQERGHRKGTNEGKEKQQMFGVWGGTGTAGEELVKVAMTGRGGGQSHIFRRPKFCLNKEIKTK